MSSSSLNEGGRGNSSNFWNRGSLINGDNDGKDSSKLSFNLDQDVDARNMDIWREIWILNIYYYFINKKLFY